MSRHGGAKRTSDIVGHGRTCDDMADTPRLVVVWVASCVCVYICAHMYTYMRRCTQMYAQSRTLGHIVGHGTVRTRTRVYLRHACASRARPFHPLIIRGVRFALVCPCFALQTVNLGVDESDITGSSSPLSVATVVPAVRFAPLHDQASCFILRRCPDQGISHRETDKSGQAGFAISFALANFMINCIVIMPLTCTC